MKIIFNHRLDWFWQIYDEWNKNNELVIPINYKRDNYKDCFLDFDALEDCIEKNKDANFIFGFMGDLYDLIKWNQRKYDIPVVIFATNAIERPNNAKRSVFAKLWYVEKYAKLWMQKYEIENTIYLGMAANPYIFHPIKNNKIYDVGFLGQQYGERGYWLEVIRKFCKKNKFNYYFPLGHGSKLFWSFKDINRFYNQTKINLSFAPKEPPGRIVNLRTFEICMSGNFQLMQYTPCVEEYFEIDEEIVCWRNKKELFEKIIYYLENEDEREKIAKKGYQKAINEHTWSKRLEKLKIFLEKKEKIDFLKIKNNFSIYLGQKELDKFQYLPSNQKCIKIIETILEKLKYNIRNDLKRKKSIKIKLKNKNFYFKPNLKSFYFIKFSGKILMVIKTISTNNKINSNDWDDLEKVLYLIENIDGSLPQFGLLTNGLEGIIYDFKNRTWLKNIPNRKALKSRVDFKYFIIMKIIIIIKSFYQSTNFYNIVPLRIKIELKKIYIRLIKLIQRI